MSPYIVPKTRDELRAYESTPLPKTPGELNYILTRILDRTIAATPSYTEINAAIGVLECCKQEIYRRIAVDFEERKRKLNGDVFMER